MASPAKAQQQVQSQADLVPDRSVFVNKTIAERFSFLKENKKFDPIQPEDSYFLNSYFWYFEIPNWAAQAIYYKNRPVQFTAKETELIFEPRAGAKLAQNILADTKPGLHLGVVEFIAEVATDLIPTQETIDKINFSKIADFNYPNYRNCRAQTLNTKLNFCLTDLTLKAKQINFIDQVLTNAVDKFFQDPVFEWITSYDAQADPWQTKTVFGRTRIRAGAPFIAASVPVKKRTLKNYNQWLSHAVTGVSNKINPKLSPFFQLYHQVQKDYSLQNTHNSIPQRDLLYALALLGMIDLKTSEGYYNPIGQQLLRKYFVFLLSSEILLAYANRKRIFNKPSDKNQVCHVCQTVVSQKLIENSRPCKCAACNSKIQ
jgi:hypothetical protein